MPYFGTSQEWLEQSTLLLQARPSTTRVTTRYTPAPNNRRIRLRLRNTASRAATQTAGTTSTETQQSKAEDGAKTQAGSHAVPSEVAPPTTVPAELVVKTYDPVSGTCLKYRTHKAAEVGRLVAALGTLGREMAGASSVQTGKDTVMAEAGADDDVAADEEAVPSKTTGSHEAATAAVLEDSITSVEAAKGHQRAKKSVSFAAEEPPAAHSKAPEKKASGSGGADSSSGAGGGGGGKKRKKGKGK